jgi:23S rRNA pseudouridine2605 synthase
MRKTLKKVTFSRSAGKTGTVFPAKSRGVSAMQPPAFGKPTARQSSTLAKGLERLERAMAHDGVASRREAKDLITRGLVRVNGKVIKEPGYGIKVGIDTITVEGTPLANKESFVVYKPRTIETNKTDMQTKDMHDYFPKFKHLSPIGRLDKDSEGLIIMSNDGTLARALTQEDSRVSKTYLVTVREHVTDEALHKMATGIQLEGSTFDKSTARQGNIKTKPAITKRISRYSFTIILHEGRKHQIRRMCDACHLTVESLVRTNIGHLSLTGMKPGAARKLIVDDVEKLKQ